MKKKLLIPIGLIGLALLLTGCAGLFDQGGITNNTTIPLTPADPNAQPPEWKPIIQIKGEYREGELIVGYESEAALSQAARLVGGTVASRIPKLQAALIQLSGISVPEAMGKIAWAARKGELSGIRYAEPNYMRELIEPLPQETHVMGALEPMIYDPTEDMRRFQWGLDAVDAEGAWEYATGQGIVVAVVDTGVDGTHPDLQGQVIGTWYDAWDNPYTLSNEADWRTGDDSSWPPDGDHGTHVAGIIAAKRDGVGVTGLAYNAQILSIRIFSPDAAAAQGGYAYVGDFGAAMGIVEAVDKGAKVLNNSWGGSGYSQLLKAAVDYCLAHDAVFVAAMGNSSMDDREYPAGYPGVIAVGTTNAHDKKADFSTTGGWISVGAPGEQVLSTVPTWYETLYGQYPYDYWAGTSMATPFVSALSAMVLEGHPDATPYQVKRIIEQAADDIETPGFDRKTGYGRIDAAAAVRTGALPDDGGYVEVYVKTASGIQRLGGFPVPYMDITLRKGGIDRYFGQTDFEGWYELGFPTDPLELFGVGAFYGIEPGTYQVIVGGEDTTLYWLTWCRVANRVTAQGSVTVGPGGYKPVSVEVNTTMQVTLSWTENVDLDLAVWEWNGSTYVWSTPKTGGIWGTFSPDAATGGSETYTLNFPHWDYDVYYLGIVAYGNSSTATVTVVQNGVTEHYGPHEVTAGGLYPSWDWTDWWENIHNPDFFGSTGPGGPIVY